MSNLKTTLQKLVAHAKTRGLSQLSEEHVQGSYTLKVLEALGWNDGGWIINSSQEHTGKRPDIVLKDAKGWTMLVIESKDCKGQNKLDGYDTVRGKRRTYQEQIINYCKAEGVYWGVLTNFIEWRLYNAHRGILYPQNKKYAFHDLLWDGADKREYTDLLSKEGLAFLAQFARPPLCKKLGKLDEAPVYYPEEKQVRDDFFTRIKVWREALRDELWKHNQHLITDKEKVELYTQKILDRMIFMDVCHDKRIVGPDGHRAILYAQVSVYAELRKWFERMDELFNTDLFAPDGIIDKLVIRNEVLSPIVEELSGIDFLLLPVRIIGDVYEDYLGEMLRGGKKQGLQVQDDKARGKRKSQGIYYTPEYIVDYITANTVGELLKNCRTEADIKKIKALDPACGSGSFLINAFDKFYQAYKKAGVVAKIGDFAVKKTILQHNLYGVDLDERAVEICKLNLMLKALDGAKWEELKGRKLLPSLELNIRCGNSLISGKSFADKAKEKKQMEMGFAEQPYKADKDVIGLLNLRKKFYKAKEDGEKKALLAQIKRDEEIINSKLNDNLRKSFTKPSEQKPLNFEVVFPEVFAQDGFDAVIGNPPWGSLITEDEKTYLTANYANKNGEAESHIYFIERSLKLLNTRGIIGLITPNTWLAVINSKAVREYLLTNAALKEIMQLSKYIFDSAPDIVPIMIFIAKDVLKQNICKAYITEENKVTAANFKTAFERINIYQNLWLNAKGFIINLYLKPGVYELLEKCNTNKINLSKVSKVVYGIKTGDNAKYLSKTKTDRHNCLALKTGELSRYAIVWKNLYLWWCKDLAGYRKEVIEKPKIIIQYIRKLSLKRRIIAAIDEKGIYYPLNNYSYITSNDDGYSLLFIMGIISSNLINFIYANTFIDYNIKPTYLEQLPLPVINKTNKAAHDIIIKLVREMLALNKTPILRERNTIRIAAVDKQIDLLVYRLYGLSEAEIKVVEGK